MPKEEPPKQTQEEMLPEIMYDEESEPILETEEQDTVREQIHETPEITLPVLESELIPIPVVPQKIILMYIGPSDVLHIPDSVAIKQGATFTMTSELETWVNSLITHGHQFTRTDSTT